MHEIPFFTYIHIIRLATLEALQRKVLHQTSAQWVQQAAVSHPPFHRRHINNIQIHLQKLDGMTCSWADTPRI
ncbi:hypothetical protein Hanom_Chr09g00871831 [Helianthus anomalus]